jgi:GTPase SAR1 family protein
MFSAKVMLLGDMGVGKTSIMYRLVHDRFDGEY